LTAEGHWRKAYRLLTTSCGLTHYEARAIFKEHLGGLSFHRNLLHSELKKVIQIDHAEIEAWTLLTNSEDPEQFTAALVRVVYEGGDSPLIPYHVIREIIRRVRSLNPDWDESVRQKIDNSTRSILDSESRSGLNAWTERHLLTYLRINGITIEV
jgi:hypothetical protein